MYFFLFLHYRARSIAFNAPLFGIQTQKKENIQLQQIKGNVAWCKEYLISMTKDANPKIGNSAELKERSESTVGLAVTLAETTYKNSETVLTHIRQHCGPLHEQWPTLDRSISRIRRQLCETYTDANPTESTPDSNLKTALKLLALVSVTRTLIANKLRLSISSKAKNDVVRGRTLRVRKGPY
jgi:hypothetical protein